MSLLIDTHVFLWFESRSARLPARIFDTICKGDRPVLVSTASIWEIAIKRRLGKLAISGSVCAAVAGAGLKELAIGGDDAELAGALDWAHRDPFDRMLVAQCLNRGFSLITADDALRARNDIAVVWAG